LIFIPCEQMHASEFFVQAKKRVLGCLFVGQHLDITLKLMELTEGWGVPCLQLDHCSLMLTPRHKVQQFFFLLEKNIKADELHCSYLLNNLSHV